ncbi:hypothetical protein BV898_19924, partial [Hypsibius exemplaris]
MISAVRGGSEKGNRTAVAGTGYGGA